MMRIAFLPSDFNPMILMLGEAEDCRALGGVLRGFTRDERDVAFADLGFCRCVNAELTLTAQPGPPGLHRDGNLFVWRVPPAVATLFADRLEDLAEPSRIAGSEDLDCGTADGIAVKVSRGEYTDDYLSN